MNPIKPNLKTELLPLLIITVTALASFYFYANFPDQVPIHWNAAGEVDGWGSRTTGAFLFPGIIIGMYLLFMAIPYIDPKKARYDQFRKIYHVFKNLMVGFMALMYFLTSLNALGYNISIGAWIPALVGVLFIVLGNYMGKIKPNWFMGIRTPWTLSSEEVWNKTHRFGGKVFMVGGILFLPMNFIPVAWRTPLLLVIVFGIVVLTVGYSYLLYAKQEKKNAGNNKESRQPEN